MVFSHINEKLTMRLGVSLMLSFNLCWVIARSASLRDLDVTFKQALHGDKFNTTLRDFQG